MKLSFITKLGALLFFLFCVAGANATEYYADANTTSSTQNGTLANPFKTIAQVNAKMSSFAPGDIIYFKRGGVFTGTLNPTKSGTAAAPITFSNYGTGALPVITNTGRAAVTIYGKNYITLDGLDMTDLNMDPNDHYAQANLQVGVEAEGLYLVVKNCHISLVGAGINLSGNYCTIDNNTIENLRMIKNTPVTVNADDDYGASPIVVSGAYSTITSNTFKECWAYSYDYGYDGGGVEFYGAGTDGNKIMYNTAINCNGFMEFGSDAAGTSNDNVVAYNLLINCGDLVYINSSGQYAITANNLQFYNNVLVETISQFTGSTYMISIGGSSSVKLKNNIFWLTTGVDVARSGIFNQAQNVHQNNIYHLGTGSLLNFTLDASELSTTAALFTSTSGLPATWNYAPIAGSKAIDFGQNLSLTRDFAGTNITGNATPNAGILEGSATAPATLTATSTAAAVNCFGGTTTVVVAATGGTAPYTGTGNFTKSAGAYTFTVTDAAGATATTAITVTQPATALSAVATAGTILANGGTTSITTVATGGTSPYTYSLNSGTYQTSNVFTNVAAGTHTITVKDAKNCTVNQVITITQPAAPALAVSATAGSIACNGGTITIAATGTGGTSPYTYKLNNGSYQSAATFTGVAAGSHTVTIKDAAGATATATVTVTEPTALTGTVTAGTIAVNGGTTTVTTVAAGGTPAYSYKLNAGSYQTSATFTNVAAGTHTITVKDANGCTTTQSITITEPAPIPALAASATAGTIACNGGSTTVTVSATGGTAPYTGTGTFTRSAGTYTFTVTDANGATNAVTVTVTEPSAVTLVLSAGTINVNGGTTTLTATAGGGTNPFTYKLDNGTYQAANAFTGVAAGTHTVTVKDANGCSLDKTITITEPAPVPELVASATAGTIACNGGSTSVVVTATGGTAPYTGTGTFTRVAGTYTFTVTDANGVTDNVTITVAQPAVLALALTSGTITVNGGSTTLTATATGGTTPYTYKLNNGAYQASNVFTVTAGSYTVTVKDANGCTVSKNRTISQPGAPPALVASATAGTITCNGGSTSVVVTATGGTGSYTGVGTFTKTAGTYTFTVTDAAGVSDDVTITITQPAAITANVTYPAIAVNGGSTTATVAAAGGTPTYTYSIDNGTYQTSAVFTNVLAGTHTFSIKDSKGCIGTSSVTITQPAVIPPIVVTAVAGTITCNGGSTTVTVSATGGVAPYTGIGTFTKSAGTYTFTVTDSRGVTGQATITVAQPAAIVATVTAPAITVNGGSTTATVAATGGTPGYTYSIDNGTYQASNIFSNVIAGTHIFNVKDSRGCIGTRSLVITQPAAPAPIVVTAVAGTIACNGSTTTVTVTATGGNGSYTGTGVFTKSAGTYTFTVTDGVGATGNATISIAEPTAIVATVTTGTITVFGGSTTATVAATGGTPAYTYSYDNGTYQASATFSNVVAGTHTVNVKDSKGCVATKTFTVTQPGQTSTLVASAVAGTINCNGSTTTVTVTATGGTAPYTGVGTFTKGAGTFTFTVTDAAGQTSNVTITVAQPEPIAINVQIGTITTYGGTTSINVVATGGTPGYTYRLGNGQYQSSPVFDNVYAGNYTVVVKDTRGCASSKTFTVTQPDMPLSILVATRDMACRGTSNGSITVRTRGGRAPYTYSINGVDFVTTNTFTNLAAGTYTVTVKDAGQQRVQTTAVLDEAKRKCFTLGITVMGNPTPDAFRLKIATESTEKISIVVINSTGQVVYQGLGRANDITTFGADFGQGVFIAKIMQGNEVETVRLVKAR